MEKRRNKSMILDYRRKSIRPDVLHSSRVGTTTDRGETTAVLV